MKFYHKKKSEIVIAEVQTGKSRERIWFWKVAVRKGKKS